MTGKRHSRSESGSGEVSGLDPSRLQGARWAGEIPRFVKPELATLVDEAPPGSGWVHEVKFDGYRTLARIDHGSVALRSRNDKDWTEQFPQLTGELAALPLESAMLDGEVVVQLPDGTTSFEALRRIAGGPRGTRGAADEHGAADGSEAADGGEAAAGKSEHAHPDRGTGTLRYYVFDLPYLNGYRLLETPIEARRELLARLLAGASGSGVLAFSEQIPGDGRAVLEQACRLGLEGVVSKRAGSPYLAGARGADWLKAKCRNEQEFVIGGYTEPAGGRVGFGALLLGVQDRDGLMYAGKVGTGFDDRLLRGLGERLRAMEIGSPAFATGLPKNTRGMHWVEPALVAQVSFLEWTSAGSLRHPSFKGLREDKAPLEVTAEIPASAGRTDDPGRSRSRRTGAGDPKTTDRGPSSGVVLSHPEKVFWPLDHITKRGLAEYYERVTSRMLPYVVGRPVSMVRCPDGLGELPEAVREGRARIDSCFFHKHPSGDFPGPVGRITIEESGGPAAYLTITEAGSLTALAQMGVLEIHIWGAAWPDIEHPDMLVFDLDPDPELSWETLAGGARAVRDTLRTVGLESFVKTTGGKGLHVVVPIRPWADWEHVHRFCRQVADAVAGQAPEGFTANMAKAKRAGKIFVDYVRNSRGATSVAPYSTRAKEHATVAVPLRWEELNGYIRPDTFTVKNLDTRLSQLDRDPWEGYFEVQQTQALDKGMGDALGPT